jgi:hypothetical protein
VTLWIHLVKPRSLSLSNPAQCLAKMGMEVMKNSPLGWGYSPVIELSSSMWETWSSSLSTTNKQNKQGPWATPVLLACCQVGAWFPIHLLQKVKTLCAVSASPSSKTKDPSA